MNSNIFKHVVNVDRYHGGNYTFNIAAYILAEYKYTLAMIMFYVIRIIDCNGNAETVAVIDNNHCYMREINNYCCAATAASDIANYCSLHNINVVTCNCRELRLHYADCFYRLQYEYNTDNGIKCEMNKYGVVKPSQTAITEIKHLCEMKCTASDCIMLTNGINGRMLI